MPVEANGEQDIGIGVVLRLLQWRLSGRANKLCTRLCEARADLSRSGNSRYGHLDYDWLVLKYCTDSRKALTIPRS